MHFFSILGVEIKKIRRSKILLLLFLPLVILWIPNVLNADMNFQTVIEGISPEHNFFIQSFMGMAWFMMPASFVVCTVLLVQTERANRGILKMLSMPISTAKLCVTKWILLLILAAVQMLFMVGMYFICAEIASSTQNYSFTLPLSFIMEEAGILFVTSIPMIACFWMIAVCIQTPIFSVGIGLALIVPSVLISNTKMWFLYPICYPFYMLIQKYGTLASDGSSQEIPLVPWLAAACIMTGIFIAVSCIRFGREERR